MGEGEGEERRGEERRGEERRGEERGGRVVRRKCGNAVCSGVMRLRTRAAMLSRLSFLLGE
jgi:hypothetical protein